MPHADREHDLHDDRPLEGGPRRLRPTSARTKGKLFAVWALLGWCGMHRFYLGHTTMGLAQLVLSICTCGVGGLWGLVDGLLLIAGSPKDAHGLPVMGGWSHRPLYANDVEHSAAPIGQSLLSLFVHLGVIFALPFVVGFAASAFLETSEVKQSADMLVLLSIALLLPVLLLHLGGVLLKTREQARLLRDAGSLNARTFLDAAQRSAQLLTPRGFLVLSTGVAFVVLSLAYQWASLGVLAVLALTSFYVATGAAAVVSALLLRRFSHQTLARGASLYRRTSPGVVRAGDMVEDVVDIQNAPVPPGFFLLLEGAMPERLGTEVRHVVPPKARDEGVSLATTIQRTPRGSYELPPLSISFSDLLGLTKTSVASLATSRLKVLPAVKPAEVVQPPPSPIEVPDLVARLHRLPNEDLFRFREYVAGDDTRRIHWKMSMKTGRLIVKKPESRETTSKRVLIALDTYVPATWMAHATVLDDALDELVECWLSFAERLKEQGEKVTLVVRARGDDGVMVNEVLSSTQANHAQELDLGARVEWQCEMPIEAVLDLCAKDQEQEFDSAIVVTARIDPPRQRQQQKQHASETTWIYLHPQDALGPPPASVYEMWLNFDGKQRSGLRGFLERISLLPYPAGSDENGLRARLAAHDRMVEERNHRVELRRYIARAGDRALQALLSTDDAVYQVELGGGRVVLRGKKAVSKPLTEALNRRAVGTSAKAVSA